MDAPAGTAVRRQRVSRITGTPVLVVDLAAAGAPFDVETDPVYDAAGVETGRVVRCRWATLCDAHSTVCTHPTLALARLHAGDPTGWCEGCAATRCASCGSHRGVWTDSEQWTCSGCGDEWTADTLGVTTEAAP